MYNNFLVEKKSEMFRNYLSPHGTIYNDIIKPNFLSLLLNKNTLKLQRKIYKFQRNKTIKILPFLNLFISIDDIQSFILLQCALQLNLRYQFNIKIYLLPIKINGWSINITEKYQWILRDNGLYSSLYLLEQPFYSSNSSSNINYSNYSSLYQSLTLQMNSILLQSSPNTNTQEQNQEVINKILNCFRQVWGKEINNNNNNNNNNNEKISNLSKEEEELGRELDQNQTILRNLGYYNPGVIEMEGEWYPPNRLHHLERRLLDEGNNNDNSNFIISYQITFILFLFSFSSLDLSISLSQFYKY